MNTNFNLFKYSLFHYGIESKGLPYQLNDSILSFIEHMYYENYFGIQDDETRLNMVLLLIEKKHNMTNDYFVFYSLINLINSFFEYSILNYKNIIELSKISYEDVEQKNSKEYWITDWSPEKVINENFIDKIKLNFNIWKKPYCSIKI